MKGLVLVPNINLSNAIKSHISNRQIQWLPDDVYQQRGFDYSELSILILADLFPIEQQWYNLVNVWQQYLLTHNFNGKLFVVGFEKNDHPLFLDAFHLPNLPLPLGTNERFQSMGVPLVIPNTIEGKDALKRFFDGHGQQSMMAVVYKLKRKLNLLQREINAGEFQYDLLIKEYIDAKVLTKWWKAIKIRWENYKALFYWLPDCHKLHQISAHISKIDPFFMEDCKYMELFNNLDVVGNFTLLQSDLAEIRNSYVGKQDLLCVGH